MKFSLLLLLLALKILNAQATDTFATELRAKVWVAGEECTSPVTVSGYTCLAGEWMLHVGGEFESPIIGKLQKSKLHSNAEYDSYQIIPTIPIDAEKRFVLRSYQLQVSLSGEAHVVKVR